MKGCWRAPSEGFGPDVWRVVMGVREAVARDLERLRVAGGIGSSLDAEVDLYADGGVFATLASFGDELRFLLITRAARLHPIAEAPEHAILADLPGLKIAVVPCGDPKCVRCWHHRADVGGHPEHPGLCGRCVENVVGKGEVRRYA